MELSKRLQAVANMVTPGMRLADVGTDHAYIPIYLVEQNRIPGALAMDINKGPLERADENIRAHGLEERIQTRLSDGLKKMDIGETDTMIVAGMGGGLVMKILEDRRDVARSLKELILQPQSEIGKVRTYLLENQYRIVAEDMIWEDGKYYPMMKVIPSDEMEHYLPEELEYGKFLLAAGHPVLKQYLEQDYQVDQKILDSLHAQNTERVQKRQREIEEKMKRTKQLLETYFS